MAAPQQGPDPIETMEPLNTLTVDVEDKSTDVENLKEQIKLHNRQPLPSKDEKMLSHISRDANAADLSKDTPSQLGSLDAGTNLSVVYPPNVYAPQAQPLFFGGYDNTAGEWEEYPRYLNVDGMEIGSPGVYNENPSLMFHTSYGYNHQMPYGPYSPVTSPLPNASGDGQLYSPQHFPFTVHYYQQPSSPSMSYLNSPAQISQTDLAMPIDQQGSFLAGNSNSNGMFGPRPGYSLPYDSFGRDWSATPDGTGSLTPFSLPGASPQPFGVLGSFGHSMSHLASGMASPQQRSLYGFGSSISSYDRGYSHGGMYQQGSNFGGSFSSSGFNGRSFITNDKNRRRGKGNTSLCSCTGTPDFLSEQNRGPRTTRPKNPTAEQNSPPVVGPNREPYNKLEFSIEYEDAKFFIIKSYSEDNVHKSIKYGVWASTANGTRKLDSAFREAEGKGVSCPIFLFFSVNASGQFCGVAEMIGAVDFEKSVDYWQQDKWSGQFPVKWHIVKDVPNNLFRHIILENNDGKPVTNSRDTQEVNLEQGLEMLGIFKKHESDTSILDDFDFYEEREKAMQERKARQQQQQPNSTAVVVPAAAVIEQRILPSNLGDPVSQLSKSFADAVRMEESSVAQPGAGKDISAPASDKAGDAGNS